MVRENNKLKIKIKVLGIGGGGCNMIEHLSNTYLKDIDSKDIELYAVNTDQQVLEQSSTKVIAIGKSSTKGLGAGMKPEVGREAALEDYQSIIDAVQDADMVFIAAGLGGGTGTGAAPVVAQAVKETGALTISIVTRPFGFEGSKRARLAEKGLLELAKNTDSLIVVENQKLMEKSGKSLGLKTAFKMVDEVLAKAVQGIIGIVLESGKQDINVDFADLKTVLSYPGHSVMSMAVASGENAAVDAVQKALSNELLSNSEITGSRGVLIHFTVHEDYGLDKISEAMEIIHDAADEDADIIFGTATSEDMEIDEVAVTLIATGFANKVASVEELVAKQVAQEPTELALRIKVEN